MPIHFITMNLIGKNKLSHQGHQYALTVIDMLTTYTWCMLLLTKEVEKVEHTYLANVYSRCGGSHKILAHNGAEFKNKMFAQVASTLGRKQVFSSSYYPQGNRQIENDHNFLKMCI